MTDAGQALNTIRLTELDAANRLEQARCDAKDALTAARREAAEAVAEGERRGREEARRRFEAAVAAAEEEARAILAGCEQRAESRRPGNRFGAVGGFGRAAGRHLFLRWGGVAAARQIRASEPKHPILARLAISTLRPLWNSIRFSPRFSTCWGARRRFVRRTSGTERASRASPGCRLPTSVARPGAGHRSAPRHA